VVEAIGEQLGQGRLGAMNPEAALQVAKLFTGEISGIGPLPLNHQPRSRVDGSGRCRKNCGTRKATAGKQDRQ
jgi:hypothetical protein